MTGEPFSDHSNVLTFVEQPKTTSVSISILPSLLDALESDAHNQEVRNNCCEFSGSGKGGWILTSREGCKDTSTLTVTKHLAC